MSAEESVCLVLFKDLSLTDTRSGQPMIDVKIVSINKRDLFVHKVLPLSSSSFQCVKIPINTIRADRALVAVTVGDNIIRQEIDIRVKPAPGLTLIETSKPAYRPGEKLQFRVITMSDWLRPIDQVLPVVSVINSRNMPVMQWTNVPVKDGMVGLEVPLAHDNYQGFWRISVVGDHGAVTEKMFKLIDYETPTIIITIDSPDYIRSTDTFSAYKVCVRDSYGQPMKGQVRAFAGYFKYDWGRERLLRQLIQRSANSLMDIPINGCHEMLLNGTALQWSAPEQRIQQQQQVLKLSVQYTDETTGAVEQSYAEIPIATRDLMLTYPSQRLQKQHFKPGMPYFGHILALRPDYSPAPVGEPITLCYQAREVPWVSGKEFVCKSMMVERDNAGMIEFTVPPMSDRVRQVLVWAKSVNYPAIEARMMLEPAYSPSGQYMEIKPVINAENCADSVMFDVLFNKKIMMTDAQTVPKVFYQIMGDGIIKEAEHYPFTAFKQWSGVDDKRMIINGTMSTSMSMDAPIILKTKVILTMPARQSALGYNRLTRVMMYYMDSTGALVADSAAFLTTCTDRQQQRTRISLVKSVPDDTGVHTMSMRVMSVPNATCSTRVSRHKPVYTLKRVNEFIARFDVRQAFAPMDKCRQLYIQKMIKDQQAVATAPYGVEQVTAMNGETIMMNMANKYWPIVDYGDAMDEFTDMGLAVTGDGHLDDSPCDWDMYGADVLSQLTQLRDTQVKALIGQQMPPYLPIMSSKMFPMMQMQEMERSFLNEVLDWDVIGSSAMSTGSIDRPIAHQMLYTSDKLYADTVCLHKDTGIQYASNVLDISGGQQTLATRAMTTGNSKLPMVKMSVLSAPTEARIGDTIVYKMTANIMAAPGGSRPNPSGADCWPVEMTVQDSEYYDIIGADNKQKAMCICGQTADAQQAMDVMIKPKKSGAIQVKLMAKYPTDIYIDNSFKCGHLIANQSDAQAMVQTFQPQIIVRPLAISPVGIATHTIDHKIVCKDSQQTSALPIAPTMDNNMVTQKTLITNNLIEPMYAYIQTKMSGRVHNAWDALTTYSAAYYLQKYADNYTTGAVMANPWPHSTEVIGEMSGAYQALMTYRRNDGSYGGHGHNGRRPSTVAAHHNIMGTAADLPLTVAVYKVLAQSQPYMALVDHRYGAQGRHNIMGWTADWIYRQQGQDGCFHMNGTGMPRRAGNYWPMMATDGDDYQLTAYVLASLMESGLNFDTKPLYKAYNCLSQNSQKFLANIDFKPMTAVLYNYIQILSGNTLETDVWMKAVRKAFNKADQRSPDGQLTSNAIDQEIIDEVMASYLALSAYMTDDMDGAKHFGQRLARTARSATLWRTPIATYAITKLWPIMGKTMVSLVN
ncbi:unnamed protein product [Medioppia subpectinata]|uniref:Alpha-2-macroglobulin domain-containing protein n=1 Tax=Medioppia subpectinata TaxID=1979941 RepID=A0A7R9Q2W1_9ACAR|nr:unnamed protein product [Medioppia subpectinata]CAG2109863.1 unnamed protein product [Medioppia subpectinata]